MKHSGLVIPYVILVFFLYRRDQVQVENLPKDGAVTEPKDNHGVVYSVLAKQP